MTGNPELCILYDVEEVIKKIDKINYPCHKEVSTDFVNNGIWRMQ